MDYQKTSDGPIGYEKDHAINRHETNIIRAIKAANITAKLNLRIRLSYAGNAVQRPGRTVRLSISGKGICDQVSLITFFGFLSTRSPRKRGADAVTV